jgi:hypothetical protein
MKLSIQNQTLTLEFEGLEKFWAFHFSGPLEIPLAHITGVSYTKPEMTWKEIKAPGSFFPGLIKAGTFFNSRGKEFWYVTRKRKNVVVIKLHDEKYASIIVGFEDLTLIQSTFESSHVPVII